MASSAPYSSCMSRQYHPSWSERRDSFNSRAPPVRESTITKLKVRASAASRGPARSMFPHGAGKWPI